MQRKEFIKKGIGGLSLLSFTPLLSACQNNNEVDPATDTSTSGSTNGSSSSDCTVTNAETEGPFPIKDPASLVKADIVGDRSGVQLTINLSIKNKNSGCEPLANVLVDIWHCDAEGEYSEYGGGGGQSANHTTEHWLRGRQTTDENGMVAFSSIFPGWYSGRAPHIHVEVLNANEKSLLVTQIAFDKSVCDTVYTTADDYDDHGTQDTTNERDNVFGDGFDNELASISGSVDAGYELSHTIVVSA
ncbi:intradiol ring-cleavage dioxygenase [Marinilongibacter aquaticus]|uniref:dioxygenase family protein n=1 Tax=Marinilongibacter aquaticus TaxID=2975157 RepID=UPI0021BDDFF8|nr:intradiol ring-cleavage dioxygenase [Marinilongibacter aquaticus]UBM59222.1 intradiol ring-cleavage dioxygenase [Marinilongibacter aquaticus]